MPGIRFSPTANGFTPASQTANMSTRMSAPPASHHEARVANLEENHASLRGEVDQLKDLYQDLSASVDRLQQGGWPVHVGPVQNLSKSHQSVIDFKMKLEGLSPEIHGSVNGIADKKKVNGNMPPHVKATSTASNGTATTSAAPHLRGVKKDTATNGNEAQKHLANSPTNSRLVTDGPVDIVIRGPNPSTPVCSSPSPPATVIQSECQVKDVASGTGWKPYHLVAMQPLSHDIRSKIPVTGNAVTFHLGFLNNTFEGVAWSPGLRYIAGKGPCSIKNRTYYLLDATFEPFLPQFPGDHGAKLTAFFNRAPEEVFGELDDGANSYEDVPMFVRQGSRYAYFGHYSQVRWSDKLDIDSMKVGVPQHIKEFWATELSAPTREGWVTEELKKHFFKKPEYEGRLYAIPDDETTLGSVEEAKQNERMAKDVKKYVEELREWEREANMRVSMIKKDFILEAFERADADDPPALRLWWEYLQCVNWRTDFYDYLVTLQSRNPQQYLH